MAVGVEAYKNKRKNLFVISCVVLGMCVLLSIALFGYKYSLNKTHDEYRAELETIEKSIRNLEANPEIQAHKLYTRNKDLLGKMTQMSNIPAMVQHLQQAFLKYGIQAQGFSYAEGNVQIQIEAFRDNAIGSGNNQDEESRLAYTKVYNFLTEYRKDLQSAFHVPHIESFLKHDVIVFTPTFVLKDNISFVQEQEEIMDTTASQVPQVSQEDDVQENTEAQEVSAQ